MISKSSLPKCEKSDDLIYISKWNNCIGIAGGRFGILAILDGSNIYIGEFVDGSFQGQGVYIDPYYPYEKMFKGEGLYYVISLDNLLQNPQGFLNRTF